MEQNNKIQLTFKRDELLYDIRQIAYNAAKSIESDEIREALTDICEDGSVDRVTRILDLEVARCVEFLYAYTSIPISDDEMRDNILTETNLYVINMRVPSTFSKTTADLLEKQIHEYLIFRVLAGWMLDNVSSADDRSNRWLLRADNLKGEIENSLFRNMKPIRRKSHPFP